MVTDRLGPVRYRRGQSVHPAKSTRRPPQSQVKFAYYRDTNGVDYADQQFYRSISGGSLPPDPSANANPANPGNWNRYAYTSGDPVNANDPTGLLTVIIPGICIGICQFNGSASGSVPAWAYPNGSFAKAVSQSLSDPVGSYLE